MKTSIALALLAFASIVSADSPQSVTWCYDSPVHQPVPHCNPDPIQLLAPMCAERNPSYPLYTSPYYQSPVWAANGYRVGVHCFSGDGHPAPDFPGPSGFDAHYWYRCALPWTDVSRPVYRDYVGNVWWDADYLSDASPEILGKCPDPSDCPARRDQWKDMCTNYVPPTGAAVCYGLRKRYGDIVGGACIFIAGEALSICNAAAPTCP